LTRDYRALFPRLPEHTRLFRLLKTHQDWTRAFLATPTVLGVIDTYGIELIHPMREGRSPQQIGRKGLSPHLRVGELEQVLASEDDFPAHRFAGRVWNEAHESARAHTLAAAAFSHEAQGFSLGEIIGDSIHGLHHTCLGEEVGLYIPHL
jgi:hypothetical protein